ncbi:hypothetical protein [Nioella nitratireducens]|uniref:hypothetical protein n=1 Tax=Nioella nitratireducens TaxID=1287720 RepID=UPI0008FD37A9|nr:hypothetical protein [Nioella nitratireducens]
MLRALCLSVTMVFSAGIAGAQALSDLAPRTQTMLQSIGVSESLDIMRDAGRRDAAGLEEQLFPDRSNTGWSAFVDRLYAPGTLESVFVADFPEDRLTRENTAAIVAFFDSALGRRIIDGELTAWRAMLDPDVEEAAYEIYDQHRADGDPRLDLLEEFTSVNGFIDYNVMGSLNSNYAFLSGLSEGGAYPRPVPESELLAQVWQQEPTLREDTVRWLYSFQLMAYSGLSDDDLSAYIAFCETSAGQLYNQVLFQGYDAVFTAMSGRLGQAAAMFMTGEAL